jgi:hypothetical protein
MRITVRELGRANTFGLPAIPMYTLKTSDHISSGTELERFPSDDGRNLRWQWDRMNLSSQRRELINPPQ